MKPTKFLFLLVLAVIVVTASGYFIFGASVQSNTYEFDLTEPSSKEGSEGLKVMLSRGYDMISLRPKFEVGQKFVYTVKNFQSRGGDYTDEYSVKSVERINGSNVFLIVNQKTLNNNSGEESYPVLDEIYIDADDGHVVKLVKKIVLPSSSTVELTSKNDLGESTLETDNYAYLPWMLALKDGLSWTTTVNFTVSYGDGFAEGKYEYRVTSVENVKGADCFVVESIYSEFDEDKGIWENHHKVIRWVDKKSRMLVKAEAYDYDIYTGLDRILEINLVSGLEG